MFFFFPLGFGGGGILGLLIFYWIIRLILRLFFGGTSQKTYYRFDNTEDYSNFYNQYNRQYSQAQTGYKDWYAVLGVTSQATDDEIKKAYRKLILQYHPDKVTTDDPAKKEEATKRFREVQEAYENICKIRKI